MKATFKPLGLAAAVAAVTAGYAGVTQAQAELANNSLGDLGIIPYYTTAGSFVTGVHIINTDSVNTQVVKLRMRRGSDSMDALDFNLILSPNDEWTGFINDDADGTIVFATDDNSCTAPILPNGRAEMPGLYAEGAGQGYLEVIGMASAGPGEPISIGALHGSDGVPFDCQAVESNFFRNATLTPLPYSATGSKGVLAANLSAQTCTDAIFAASGGGFGANCSAASTAVLENNYGDTDNVLKVSFFHRDADSGLEFGNSAVHLQNFSDAAMMSNQEINVVGSLDGYGYLFPDLNGGSPVDPLNPRDRFTFVREALGANTIINDWSVAAARNVSTDWVVTLPGQYVMLDLLTYTISLFDPDVSCLTKEQADASPALAPNNDQFYCDERDLPVNLFIDVYDREEQTFSNPDSGLVISPNISNAPGQDVLENEVTVIQWTDGSIEPVLPSEYARKYDVSALGAESGWASLRVTSATGKTQGIYDYVDSAAAGYAVFDSIVNPAVPIVGFVAWERSFPSDPSANYGRIVEHSYESN
tara:strand:- start:87665 stop:89260 length:1596 start_codon:yes stop_codon:yes gene_type:complete